MTEQTKNANDLIKETDELIAQITAIRFPDSTAQVDGAHHNRVSAALKSLQLRYQSSVPAWMRK